MSVGLSALLLLSVCLGRDGLVSAGACVERDLRLNGIVFNRACTDCVSGALEICENEEWKKFCDRNFTMQDAIVACRTLGRDVNGTFYYIFLLTVVYFVAFLLFLMVQLHMR